MTSIAMIGTEASGKTVLVSALAKYLASRPNENRFLDPQNAFSQNYVEQVWAALQDGDWPPSTPPGTLPQLNWKLHLPGLPSADLCLVDPGGQDVRRLFADAIVSHEQIPKELQELATHCYHADIVVFLINLKDFLGVADRELRTANELALKFGMEFVKGSGPERRCCIAFTQIDLYRDLANAEGSWLNVARKYLPILFGSHLRDGEVPVFAVAAVNATRVAIDDDGSPRRVPAMNFASEGFDELLSWIESIERNKEASEEQSTQNTRWREFRESAGWILGSAFVACVLLSAFRGMSCRAQPTPSGPVVSPIYSHVDPGFFSKSVVVSGWVTNPSESGYFTVYGTVTQGGNRWVRSEPVYLGKGERKWVQFTFEEYSEGTYTYDMSAK